MSVHLLASIVGQSLAIGPIARLRTRHMYDSINHRWSWHDKLLLSDGARDELIFWREGVEKFNGQPIWFSSGATRVVY